eukprot:5038546-Amphidinium_carterae.1
MQMSEVSWIETGCLLSREEALGAGRATGSKLSRSLHPFGLRNGALPALEQRRICGLPACSVTSAKKRAGHVSPESVVSAHVLRI